MAHSCGDRCQFDHLMSIGHPLEELRYITTKSPSTGTWIDLKTLEIYYRPKIGEVYVSMSENHKRYATAAGAYRVAVKIKQEMIRQMAELEKVYSRRPMNLKIINEHFMERNHAI